MKPLAFVFIFLVCVGLVSAFPSIVLGKKNGVFNNVNNSLCWNGLCSVAEIDLNNLGDINAGTPSDDEVLTWDSGTNKWVSQSIGGNYLNLSGTNANQNLDLGIYNLSANEIIAYTIQGGNISASYFIGDGSFLTGINNNIFDQELNTTENVSFNGLNISGVFVVENTAASVITTEGATVNIKNGNFNVVNGATDFGIGPVTAEGGLRSGSLIAQAPTLGILNLGAVTGTTEWITMTFVTDTLVVTSPSDISSYNLSGMTFATDQNITADYYFGDGSLLTGISAGNIFDQELNTTSNVTFDNVIIQTGGGSGASANPLGNDLVIDSNTYAGLSILTPNDSIAFINFGDPEDNNIGILGYLHSTDVLNWRSDGITKMQITPTEMTVLSDLNVTENGFFTGNLTLFDPDNGSSTSWSRQWYNSTAHYITTGYGKFVSLVDMEIYDDLDVHGDLNVIGNITSENVFIPQYLFAHTNANITLESANVWRNVSFEQEDSDIKMGILHTFNDVTNHTFTIAESGVYDISFDMDVEDTSVSSTDIDVAGRFVYVNGTELIGSDFESDIQKRGVETELSHRFLARLSAGDEIVLQFVADNVNVRISTHGSFGDHPESVSIVINKIANLI